MSDLMHRVVNTARHAGRAVGALAGQPKHVREWVSYAKGYVASGPARGGRRGLQHGRDYEAGEVLQAARALVGTLQPVRQWMLALPAPASAKVAQLRRRAARALDELENLEAQLRRKETLGRLGRGRPPDWEYEPKGRVVGARERSHSPQWDTLTL